MIFASFLAVICAFSAAAQDVYVGDPAHTYAFFETGHLGISWIRGRFNKTTAAKVVLDQATMRNICL